MICPHCDRSLYYRQRSGRRCSLCRKEFALDPKLNGKGMHDVRMRRIATRITDDGRLHATVDQLRWACERKGRPDPRYRGSRGGAGCLAVVGTVALFAAFGFKSWPAVLLALAGAAVLGLAVRSYSMADTLAPPAPVHPQRSPESFRGSVVERWQKVYGRLPERVVDENDVAPRTPDGPPALALLCPDRAVAGFLHANDFPRRQRALIVTDLRLVPDGVPVAVLHDASPQGCLLVAEARRSLPGRRVVDAGLPARAVLAAEATYVHLRDPHRSAELGPRLQQLPGLGPAELAWYADGWWSPLAAVRPRKLLAAAERAAQRATAAPSFAKRAATAEDPAETRRRALAVGFLTWPEHPGGTCA
ncbi:hypothetical protein ACWGB8_25680 [Kitasatospora sp. NPDC054939]